MARGSAIVGQLSRFSDFVRNDVNGGPKAQKQRYGTDFRGDTSTLRRNPFRFPRAWRDSYWLLMRFVVHRAKPHFVLMGHSRFGRNVRIVQLIYMSV